MNPENTNENEKDASGSSSSISSDLIRGHINTIILRTLYDGDKYGYEIINEIEEKSKGQYTLKQPTLYSALKRLESQDFLTSYWGGVSNGGRRKYFQITDKGRKVVEQNLAEWEYSRTVIDSLISERDYDFSNPPPAASVDFNILKKSTTRVPVGKGEDEDFIELGEGEYGEASESSEEAAPVTDSGRTESFETAQPVAPQEPSPAESVQEAQAETAAAEASTQAPAPQAEQAEPAPAAETESQAQQAYATQSAPDPSVSRTIPESPIAPKEEAPLSEEEKQRIHENYKVLIGDDTDATSYYYTHVAQRNREDRNTFDRSVFGDAPREEYSPQPPMQEPVYEQPPQEMYAPQPAYYYAPEEPYGGQMPPPAQPAEQPAPPPENDAAELLYANKSPAERNYKSLLSRLYDNTVKTHEDETEQYGEPAAQTHAEQYSAEPEPQTVSPEEPAASPAAAVQTEKVRSGNTASNIEFYDVEEKAKNEGLRITTTNGARNRTVSKTANNTFDKGRTLFFTAIPIFIIALAESIINICLQDVMHSHMAYVVIPFVIDFVMLGVFLFLYLRGYGKNSRKSQSKSYISASLIIFVNLVLITCLIAYLISAATDSSLNFMIYAIFPCVYLFNIPLFAILYNYNTNKS